MSQSVTIRPRAQTDIDEIVDYLTQHSPQAAQRFADALAALCFNVSCRFLALAGRTACPTRD